MKFAILPPIRIIVVLVFIMLGISMTFPPLAHGQEVVFQSDFSSGVDAWKLWIPPSQRSSGGSIEQRPGVGREGGTALAAGGEESISFLVFNKDTIPVEPGQRYRVNAWFRGSADPQLYPETPAPFMRLGFKAGPSSDPSNYTYLSGDGQAYTFEVGASPDELMGKWFHVPKRIERILLPKSALDTKEWNKIDAVVEIPAGTSYLDIGLLAYKTVGKVLWEQIKVERVLPATPLSPVDAPAASAPTASAPTADNPAELSEVDRRIMEAISGLTVEQITAPGLAKPVLNTSPLPKYSYKNLDYGMTIGIERSPGGRLWAAWIGGGDNDKAFLVVANSDDDGATWNEPSLVIDPHDDSLPLRRRTLVGNLWTDPKGRLWLFFDQSVRGFDGRAGNWYTICENPDAEKPTWSEPVRLSYGCSLNKPIVLANGDWLLPVSLWPRRNISFPRKIKDQLFPELDQYRMANIFASSDQGKTWERRGGVVIPNAKFDEPMLIERRDGSIWMTARTRVGMYESTSTDGGRTWSAPVESPIKTASSRHFIRRLASGNLVLVKHGTSIGEAPANLIRSHLTAFLSDDDGATWKGGLLLDERKRVSYPDGFQAPDGTIYVSWDWERNDEGQVLMARFTEEDIMAGAFISPRSRNQMLISRPNPEAVKARKKMEAEEKDAKQGEGA